MYDFASKVILSDCDGVLVDWEVGFYTWMRSTHNIAPKDLSAYSLSEKFGIAKARMREYGDEFMQTDWPSRFPPLRDAIKYIRKLHEEFGMVLHVISAVDESFHDRRLTNLRSLFGPTSILQLDCVGDNAPSKTPWLEPYRNLGNIWVEDRVLHAEEGLDLGLKCFLINQTHNYHDHVSRGVQRTHGWEKIYRYVESGGIYGGMPV